MKYVIFEYRSEILIKDGTCCGQLKKQMVANCPDIQNVKIQAYKWIKNYEICKFWVQV